MSFNHGNVTSPVLQAHEQQLQQTEHAHAQQRRELQHMIQVRATTPMSAVETDQKDREIAGLQHRLQQTEAEMAELRNQISRQQMTIKRQSETISNPKAYYPAATPARFGEPQQMGSMHGHRPGQHLPPLPSVYDQQGSHRTPYSASRSQQWSTPMSRQPQAPQLQRLPPSMPQHGHTNVNQYGSPEPARPFNTNIGHHASPQVPGNPPAGGNLRAPGSQFTQQPASGDNSMALVRVSDISTPEAAKAQFAKVWHMAETYCYSHVYVPSTIGDQALPQDIKDRLLRATAPVPAFPIMADPDTRFLLVNKIVIQWIIKHILKHDSFYGFDRSIDGVIEANRGQIYSQTPAQIKYQLLSTIGFQMSVLKQKPGFQDFVNKLTRDRGNQLWAILKPMMHNKTTRDWEDLHSLMIEAHHLAQVMNAGAEQYRFETPTANQTYRKEFMVPRDRSGIPPEQFERRGGATVKVGLTPHIIVRTSTPSGLVSESTVLPACVLTNGAK
jgi:hypothetical protein